MAARDTGGSGSLHHETAGECLDLINFFMFQGCLFSVFSY